MGGCVRICMCVWVMCGLVRALRVCGARHSETKLQSALGVYTASLACKCKPGLLAGVPGWVARPCAEMPLVWVGGPVGPLGPWAWGGKMCGVHTAAAVASSIF